MRLAPRTVPSDAQHTLEQAGVHPLLAQLYAARGVASAQELDAGLAQLLPPTGLLQADRAARLLADAIEQQRKLCIVADYDCDGATACAVGLRGLRLLGAQHVNFLVPDRVHDGYGLTPPIAERVKATGAEVLITVDNGIASIDGVAAAQALGMQVLVTDHHLPGDQLPQPEALVNPNQPGCPFPSKAMAGVGVMFYVLLALRAELRARGHWAQGAQPRLDTLLPLVALGTVADVVKLDANNRRLVTQGLQRIRQGAMPAGLRELFNVAGRAYETASTFDLGFALGPRINAAGRLSDMTLGIVCLSTDDATLAAELAQRLDHINRERRELEGDMRDQAMAVVDQLVPAGEEPPHALSIVGEDFHEGVIGIVASRLKDRLHRPIFVFAPSASADKQGQLKGSGRSIPGFHLRDALDLISKRHPEVILHFGGHAMAAGCTIHQEHFATFRDALERIATEWLDAATLQRTLETDGALPAHYRNVDMATTLQQAVWGQGFLPPVFSEPVEIVQQRIVGERHTKLQLRHQGELVDAIWFGHSEPLPRVATLAYRLDVNTWRGETNVQLVVEGMAEA